MFIWEMSYMFCFSWWIHCKISFFPIHRAEIRDLFWKLHMLSLLFAFFHLAAYMNINRRSWTLCWKPFYPRHCPPPHLTHIHDMTHGDNFVHYCVVFVATESQDSRTNAVKSLLLYTFQSMYGRACTVSVCLIAHLRKVLSAQDRGK